MRVTEDEVHVHEFHATCLYLVGIDHEHLIYRHQEREKFGAAKHDPTWMQGFRVESLNLSRKRNNSKHRAEIVRRVSWQRQTPRLSVETGPASGR